MSAHMRNTRTHTHTRAYARARAHARAACTQPTQVTRTLMHTLSPTLGAVIALAAVFFTAAPSQALSSQR